MLTQNELDSLGVWDWDADGFPPYWEQLRRYVFKRDGYRCKYCHKVFRDARKLDAHHIIWRDRGGSDNPRNLATACEPCHNQIHLGESPVQQETNQAEGLADDFITPPLTQVTLDGMQYPISQSLNNLIAVSVMPGVVRFITQKKQIVKTKLDNPQIDRGAEQLAKIKLGQSVMVRTNDGWKQGLIVANNAETNSIGVKIKNANGQWVVVSKTLSDISKR